MVDLIPILLMFLPFIAVTWLANWAERKSSDGYGGAGLVRLTYGVLILLGSTGLLVGGGLWLIGTFLPDAVSSLLGEMAASEDADPLLAQRLLSSLPTIGIGALASSIYGLFLLLPAVRRRLSRLIPIDPHRPVHAMALAFTALILANLLVTLGVGLDVLAETAGSAVADRLNGNSQSLLMAQLWLQQGLMALWALIGVGWLSRHSLYEVFTRLGLVSLGPRELVMGIGGGLAGVAGVALVGGIAQALGVGTDPDVQSLTDVLMGPLFTSLPGILTIGLAAALGEEAIFRGALQPRFGITLTTLLFALTHSTYGITLSTLIVFLVGLIFALLRRHINTTAAMVAHAVYNTSLGMMVLLAARVLENMQI